MSRPLVDATPRQVHRVGRKPDPWGWVPWQYGPFAGRWDDPAQGYRVLYTGDTRFACFVEVLAAFRPDLSWLATLDDIEGDDEDIHHPSLPPGTVNRSWVQTRSAGVAFLDGRHVDVGAATTLAWLRPLTATVMVRHGIDDMDGAAIRSANRAFTRDLSRFLHEASVDGRPFDGVLFESRHGDRLKLSATFERAGDGGMSSLLSHVTRDDIATDDADIRAAMDNHGLIYTRS